MKLSFQDYDHMTVLAVEGDLCGDASEKLRRDVLDRLDDRIRDFVLDISQMEFVDSRGLEAMLWLQDRCADHLGQVRLAGCQENVKTILAMTRLASRFDTHEDVDSAIRSLR